MKTLFIGQNSTHLKTIDSTNSYASELLREIRPAEGTFFYTYNQSKGKGQRGNVWESEPNKNVALSLILYPTFLQASRQFLLNKIIPLAVADLMAEMLKGCNKSQDVRIKWPNDIYVKNKKISGILIENSLRESSLLHSIVGIGLNINQKSFSGSAVNATSLAILAGKEFDLMMCIELLCEFIEARYLQLRANHVKRIDEEYVQYLYQYNEWHHYSSDNQKFEGKIRGISAIGKLQIELKTGSVEEFDLKEVQFLNL